MRATIYTYPWDLTDEGIDSALDTIAHTAGLNSVSLAQSYHISTYFSAAQSPTAPLLGRRRRALLPAVRCLLRREPNRTPNQQRRRWPRLHAPDRG